MKGELGYTQKTMASDQARLNGQTQECNTKAAEWAERQKAASEEMAVIDKASEILSTGVSLAQRKAKVPAEDDLMLLQGTNKGRKSHGSSDNDDDEDEDAEDRTRDKLAEAFKKLSRKYNSYAL